jgi:tetratricopeptide (TPR) repeat protein
MRRDQRDEARERWQRAIALGVHDPDICYRFAALASWAGEDASRTRPALERAIQLRPDFDDARFLLAMIEKNAGNFERAVGQLTAMRSVSPQRAYSYWSSLADGLIEMGHREEAVAAARHAADNAKTPDERAHAAALGYIARTDMAVQFERGSDGTTRMVTTRIPHGTENWNPFVESGDDLRSVRGKLREIECGDVTRFRFATSQGALTLTLPDPSRVEMRSAPPEFTCGEQSGYDVTVEYAAKRDPKSAGVIRGMNFESPR